jgi:hypothetical protein
MEDRNRKLKLSKKTILIIIERIMRRDALLQPYFEDGRIRVIGRPEDDYVSFKPGISGETRKFILDRIRTLRGTKPEEWNQEKFEKWEEREEMIREAEADEELAWYFKEGYLGIENNAEKCGVWINAELPEEEKRWVHKKLMAIWLGEEVDDDVAEKMTEVLSAQHEEEPSSTPELGEALRELVIEALREDEMIAEYIEAGLIKFNNDPKLKIWEIDRSVTPGELRVLHNQGIYVLTNRFGIDPDIYFQSKQSK